MKPAKAMATEGYSTGQVSEMTGASLRQLQWWDEQGIVCPERFNGDRSYTYDQVEMIGRFVQLRKLGASQTTIWEAFATFGWKSKVVVSKRRFASVDGTLVLFAGRSAE